VTRRRAPFRIAHLSDLHLTARDGAPRSEPRLLGELTGTEPHPAPEGPWAEHVVRGRRGRVECVLRTVPAGR